MGFFAVIIVIFVLGSVAAIGNDYGNYHHIRGNGNSSTTSAPQKYYRRPKWCSRWEKENQQEDSYQSYKYYGEMYGWEMSTKRWSHFCYNMCQIKYHNDNPNATWKKGINEYGCYHPKEFAAKYARGAKVPADLLAKQRKTPSRSQPSSTKTTSTTPPGSHPSLQSSSGTCSGDWISNSTSLTGPVTNQGQCGACWAFSASQTIGCRWAFKYGVPEFPIYPSEQESIDCIRTSNGCGGGWPADVCDYSQAKGGMFSRDAYPFTGSKGTCQTSDSPRVGQVSSHSVLQNVGLCQFCGIVSSNGCATIAMYAPNSLQFYKSGVFSCSSADNIGNTVTHAVCVVGCQILDGITYFICKNSWGSDWGQSGYFWLNADQTGGSNCNAHLYAFSLAIP